MNRSIYKPALLALSILVASGCTVEGNMKYTGGGTLNSAGGDGKAVLTVNADTCDGNENAKGQIKLSDSTAMDFLSVGGVALNATILKAGICSQTMISGEGADGTLECECDGWPAVKADYTSTNPAAPGTGRLIACFYNAKEQGAQSSESEMYVHSIKLKTGPYDGYINTGMMSGNITTHECKTAG